jgi:nucleotide-binding universal stress UspA family protein
MLPAASRPSPMPARVVVAVDPSTASERAVASALSVVRCDVRSEFVFCHVIDVPRMLAHADRYADDYELALDAARAEGRSLLDHCVGVAERAGIFARSCLRYGKPATEIVALADACVADLIVVGNRPSGRLHRVFSEPVPDEVVRTSGIPVLVVAGERI